MAKITINDFALALILGFVLCLFLFGCGPKRPDVAPADLKAQYSADRSYAFYKLSDNVIVVVTRQGAPGARKAARDFDCDHVPCATSEMGQMLKIEKFPTKTKDAK